MSQQSPSISDLTSIKTLPVQSSNYAISVFPSLATYLLQILIYQVLLVAYHVTKGNLRFSHVLEDGL